MNKRYLRSSVFVVFVVITLVAVAGSAEANSGSVDNVEIINREDVDGDGYASSFQVRVEADTDFAEPGGLGKGDPILILGIRTNHGKQDEVARKSNVGRQQSGTWIFNVDGSDVEDLVRESAPTEIYSVKASLYDEGKGPGIFKYDVSVDDLTLVTEENNLLENPSQDELGTLRVESNPGNAEVRIDGELEGETPLDIELPVDVGEREGSMTVTVDKAGYEPASRSGRIAPPDTFTFDLNEIQKPIVVSSNPTDANVYVDGNRVGTTPWSGNYWIKESVDIRVEKSGYTAKTKKDVSAEATLHFDLTNESSDDSSSGGGFIQDPILQDPTIGDIYIPEIQQLPQIQSFIQADFTYSPSSAVTGETVRFNASPSYGLGMSIDSYSWDFDDGSTASGEVVSHSFTDSGTYTVELEIESQNGNTSTATETIQVTNLAPNARFASSAYRANVSEQIRLNASSSNDPDGNLVSYSWSLGDGTTASGQTVTHSYGSTGTYTVELLVEDDNGETDTVNTQIEVLRQPNAAFTMSKSGITVGESVTFDASGSNDPDGSISTYRWNFDDGSISGGQTVTHIYNSTGTYTVELTVQDNDARTDLVTKQIQVTGDDSGTNNQGGGGQSQDTGTDQSDGQTNANQQTNNQERDNATNGSQSTNNQSSDNQSDDSGGIVDTIVNIFDSIADLF